MNECLKSPRRFCLLPQPGPLTDGAALAFLRGILRGGVGAIAPTSRGLAESMVEMAGVRDASRIIELGAGTGAVTEEILRAKSASAHLIAVEQDPEFAAFLENRFPQIRVQSGCVSRLSKFLHNGGMEGADCILSSLPWTCFEDDFTDRVLHEVGVALRPGGVFVTVCCYGLHLTRTGRRFRQRLERSFENVHTGAVTWRNFPPAFIYRAARS